jgi:hypothetical protein
MSASMSQIGTSIATVTLSLINMIRCRAVEERKVTSANLSDIVPGSYT